MATVIVPGLRNLRLVRDMEGHRTYTFRSLVLSTDKDDGPETVLGTAGLAAVGAAYATGNDSDPWAFCTPGMTIQPHNEVNSGRLWFVDQEFTTKFNNRCQTTTIEDPLDEPDRIGGSFVKYTKEAVRDRNGNMIKSSSHELFRGPQVEFDHNRPTVRIEQNVSSLGLDSFSGYVDTVNDATLWGLGARKVKLSNVSWERKHYGVCSVYYTRIFDFDIDFNGWDRRILDEGTKVLNGRWGDNEGGTGSTSNWILINVNGSAPDPANPQHFIRYTDLNGNIARVVLDGNGEPLADGSAPFYHDIEYYDENNFLLLGVPASL